MTAEIDARLATLRPNGPDEMGRELAGGPAAVEATLDEAERCRAEIDAARAACQRIVLVGTGASFAMARAAAPLFRAREAAAAGSGRPRLGRPVVLVEASAALLAPVGEENLRSGDLVILVSQSGASPETLAAARHARTAGALVLAVTAAPESPLALTAAVVLHTPSGPEGGAATKSEIAALAALATVAGALASDAASGRRLRALLETIVADADAALPAGRVLGAAEHAWAVGFGTAAGLAGAAMLLLHEKALLTTVATTPSEFRHGPIEAAGSGDAVLLIETDAPDARRTAYLARLAAELGEMGVPLVATGPGPLPTSAVPLPVDDPPGVPALLATLLRIQQVARVAAHARGTYRDGFRILRSIVTAAGDLD
jgi:glucosamine--fructose-6-phosphate aminotransferase (isomerizing)